MDAENFFTARRIPYHQAAVALLQGPGDQPIHRRPPILQCPDAVDAISAGDEVEVDTASGKITNLKTGKSYQAMPFPEFMQNLISAGGLIAYAQEKIKSGPKCK